MPACERTWPDRRLLLNAVARIAGADSVQVTDEVLPGESASAFVAASGDDHLVVKLAPGGRNALDNQRRLVSGLLGEATRRPSTSARGDPAASSSPCSGACPARACTGRACRPNPSSSQGEV